MVSRALACLVGASALAQATHVVGPGGFAQVQNALQVASPGDVIVVLPGFYLGFTANIGVTVVAAVPGTVTLGLLAVNFNLPPAQEARLIGLRCQRLNLQGGLHVIDDCHLDGPGCGMSAIAATVTMRGCTILPTVPQLAVVAGLTAWTSDVTATDCAFAGTNAQASLPPSEAVSLFGSQLRGHHLLLQGGLGAAAMPALRADAASQVWLSDSTANADVAACTITAAQGRVDRCVLTPVCSSIASGFVLGVSCPQPPQVGTPFTMTFDAPPGTAIGVFADLRLARSTWSALEQSLLLPVATAIPVGVLVAGASGSAAINWTPPPGATGQAVWLQAFAGFAYPLQASAPAGGVIR